MLLAAGCQLVQTTAELPAKTVTMVSRGGKAKPTTADPVEVQQTVLRFADEFAAGMIVGVDKLRRGTNALDLTETLQWKIALDSETCAIASGPNAYANLLDLTVFVSVVRAALAEHWQPKLFGDSAQPMLESCRNVETNLWLFTGKVLNPAQQVELRFAIQNWRRQNPQPEGVLAARAVGFAAQVVGANQTDPAKPGSVFNLLLLDPLAGMDPAVRELAQSRLFAERALYVTQKMPRLVRWQTELLSLNTVRLPVVQQMVTNATQITLSMDSFARVAEQLPKLVNDQREAAIRQMFAGIASERTNLQAILAADELQLRPTLVELRQTVEAATELVKSSDATVRSLARFMTRFDQDPNAPAPATTNTRPFDILDYAATAKEFTATLRELNTTITSLDQVIPQVQQANVTFQNSGDRLLNRFFLLGAGLVALASLGLAAAALLHRRPGKSSRFSTPPSSA